MRSNWHDAVQRYLDGQLDAEESTVFHRTLKESAELRALYLDYVNLEVALAAAAEAPALTRESLGKTRSFPPSTDLLSWPRWRWVASVAACLALVLCARFYAVRQMSRPHMDVTTALTSTQSAIARLSIKPLSTLPDWLSPTASLLDQPRITK